jgi:hypothetical protein
MSISLDNVKKGEHIYSCKCGWIDRAHASMDETVPENDIRRDVMEVFNQFPPPVSSGTRSPGGRGWTVRYIPPVGIVSKALPFAFPGLWFVTDQGGDLGRYQALALRLYQLGNEKLEAMQAPFDPLRHSSFSYEDLPSNTIAWYRGVFSMGYAKVKDICVVVSKADSEKLAAKINIDSILDKNHDWTRALLFNDQCDECKKRGFSGKGFTDLPAEFRKVTPGNVTLTPGVGDAWPYIWNPATITLPVPLPLPSPFPPTTLPLPIPIPPDFTDNPYPPWDTPPDFKPRSRLGEARKVFESLFGKGRTPGGLR